MLRTKSSMDTYSPKQVIAALASVERQIPAAKQIKQALEHKIILSKPTINALGNIILYTLSDYDEKKANIAISLLILLNLPESLKPFAEHIYIRSSLSEEHFPIFQDFVNNYIGFCNQHTDESYTTNNELHQEIMRSFPAPEAHIDDGILHTSLWSINRPGTVMYDTKKDVFKPCRQKNNGSKSLGNLLRDKVEQVLEEVLTDENTKSYQIPQGQVVTFFGGLSKEKMPAIHKSSDNQNNTPPHSVQDNLISAFINSLNNLPDLNNKNQILIDLSSISEKFADQVESDGKLFSLSKSGRAKNVKK